MVLWTTLMQSQMCFTARIVIASDTGSVKMLFPSPISPTVPVPRSIESGHALDPPLRQAATTSKITFRNKSMPILVNQRNVADCPLDGHTRVASLTMFSK